MPRHPGSTAPVSCCLQLSRCTSAHHAQSLRRAPLSSPRAASGCPLSSTPCFLHTSHCHTDAVAHCPRYSIARNAASPLPFHDASVLGIVHLPAARRSYRPRWTSPSFRLLVFRAPRRLVKQLRRCINTFQLIRAGLLLRSSLPAYHAFSPPPITARSQILPADRVIHAWLH